MLAGPSQVGLTVIHRVTPHSFIQQPRQPCDLTSYAHAIINSNLIIPMHTLLNAQPHHLTILHLINHAIKIIPEHSCSHRLAPALQICNKPGYNGIQSTKHSDQDMRTLTCTKPSQRSAEHDLREQKCVGERGCKEISCVLCIAFMYCATIKRSLEASRPWCICWSIARRNANEQTELLVDVLFATAAVADEV